MIVYKITNTINGKCYIGQTRRPLGMRFQQHAQKSSHCRLLSTAIAKYGRKSFEAEVLVQSDCQLVISSKEIELIKQYDSLAPKGYNITSGGEYAVHTEATRKIISQNMTGSKNHQYGKKQSAETRAKRSAALKGRKRPQWIKDKIRANHNPASDKNLTFRRKSNNPAA